MLKPGAKVGVCPVCDQNVPVRQAAGRRWEMPSVVGEHHSPTSQWCRGEGDLTASRSRAWGWPAWEQMSDHDQQSALVHVMECSTPLTVRARSHPDPVYRGRVLRDLSPRLACVHAWDQIGGWDRALDRWGVEGVRELARGRVPVDPGEVLRQYGCDVGAEPFVEDGRVVGVRVPTGGGRPPGWLWKHTPPGPAVAVPDRRTAYGRAIDRHLMLVESVAWARVGHEDADEHLGKVLRRDLRAWRPIEVEVGPGEWVTVSPVHRRVTA